LLVQEREALYKASVVDYVETTAWHLDLSIASEVRKDLKRLETLKTSAYWDGHTVTAEIDYTPTEELPSLKLHFPYEHPIKLDAPEFRLWPRPEFRLTSLITGRDRMPSLDRVMEAFKGFREARWNDQEPSLGVIEVEKEESFGAILKHLEVFHFGSALISYELLSRVLDVATQLERLFVLLANPEGDEQPRLVARLDQSQTLTDLGIYFGEIIDTEWQGHYLKESDPVVAHMAIPSFPNALNRKLRTVRCFVFPFKVVNRHMATHKRGDCRKSRDKQIQGTRNPSARLYLAVPTGWIMPNPAWFVCALKYNLPPGIYPWLESAADQHVSDNRDTQVAFQDGINTGSTDNFVEWVNDLLYGPGKNDRESAGPECWTLERSDLYDCHGPKVCPIRPCRREQTVSTRAVRKFNIPLHCPSPSSCHRRPY
jgi:hypothetical protein